MFHVFEKHETFTVVLYCPFKSLTKNSKTQTDCNSIKLAIQLQLNLNKTIACRQIIDALESEEK